jgi:hypothetical protein
MVFGIGLVLTGRILSGLCFLGLGAFALAFVLSPDASVKACLVSLAGLICSIAFAYHALTNEIHGSAIYHRRTRGPGEPVTKANSPKEFRLATNMIWALSVFFMTASMISFLFYRKLEQDAAEFR